MLVYQRVVAYVCVYVYIYNMSPIFGLCHFYCSFWASFGLRCIYMSISLSHWIVYNGESLAISDWTQLLHSQKKRGTKDWPPKKWVGHGWTKHTIPGLQPSLITYTSLIKASAQTGDLFSAEAWLRAAESSGLRLDIQIFTAVIDAAARADPNGRIDGEF